MADAANRQGIGDRDDEDMEDIVSVGSKRPIEDGVVVEKQVKPRMDTTTASLEANVIVEQQQQENENEKEEISLIIELGEKAVRDNLHLDRGTFLELLKRSPFGACHTGRPQFQITKKRVIVNIKSKEFVPFLLKVDKLVLDDEEWPVTCKLAENAGAVHKIFGVIKIHPSISEKRIKDGLLRTNDNIDEVLRISKRTGPTFSVRLSFKNNVKPEKVIWGDRELFVYTFNPGVLICNVCSKGGHLAKNCNSVTGLKCPLCADKHGKDACPLKEDRDMTKRKCANCGGEEGHGAIDQVCPYFKNEKKIVAVMVELGVQRHEAKKLVKDIDSEIVNIRDKERNLILEGSSHRTTSFPPSFLGVDINGNSSQSILSSLNSNQSSHVGQGSSSHRVNNNKDIFGDKTSRFFRDAFAGAGSYADKTKGVNKEAEKTPEKTPEKIPEKDGKKDSDSIVKKTIIVHEVAIQTDMLGIHMEDYQDTRKSPESEKESQNTLLSLALILMKMMEIMSTNVNANEKKDKLASSIEDILKISLPDSCKTIEIPSSPLLTKTVLERRNSLNLEGIRNPILSTPKHIGGISTMNSNSLSGKFIEMEGVDSPPTGLSQFVDNRSSPVSINQVIAEGIEDYFETLNNTPNRNLNSSPSTSKWLWQKPHQ